MLSTCKRNKFLHHTVCESQWIEDLYKFYIKFILLKAYNNEEYFYNFRIYKYFGTKTKNTNHKSKI